MILFSTLTLVMFIWILYLNNEIRTLRNNTNTLAQEIEGAAASCGRSMN